MAADRMRPAPCRLARALTLVTIGFTAAVSAFWSHAKLLSQDEMYEFQTDSVASLRQLLHVQRSWPISLDPPLYHALSHAAMGIFGVRPFAQRLPAMLGFLLMQGCVFLLVRRLAGERAAAAAASFPALTATLYYSVEGRPYGLLLGLYAAALLCWLEAAGRNGRRRAFLAGLAAAIAAALNTHYFGVLLLGPICAGELWRSLARRRVDWAVLSSIALGSAAILLTRPYMQAAGAFRAHYYNAGRVGLRDISRAYRSIFVSYTTMSLNAQRIWAAALCILAVWLAWGCWLTWRHGVPRVASWAWMLLIALAALPFAGYLLALVVTHSIEVRYVAGALIAVSALTGIALSRAVENDLVFSSLMILMGLGVVSAGAVRVHAEEARSRERLDTLVLPEEALVFLRDHPDRPLYVQDMGAFEEDRYYEPDPQVRARMTLVYSSAEELRWNGHDTMALTAMHMQRFTSLPIASYEQIRAGGGEQLFVMRHSGWDWTDQAFAAESAQVRVIGHAFDGDVALVTFR